MDIDPAGLKRIKDFMECVKRAKQVDVKLSFMNTPTEHGDNINVFATIEGKRENTGILF